MKQEMTRWQWHQLDRMQIIRTSLQTNNHTSTSSVNFFTGPDTLPDAQPTASKHWKQQTNGQKDRKSDRETETKKQRNVRSVFEPAVDDDNEENDATRQHQRNWDDDRLQLSTHHHQQLMTHINSWINQRHTQQCGYKGIYILKIGLNNWGRICCEFSK